MSSPPPSSSVLPPSPPPQDSSSSGSSPPSPKQLPAELALVTWSEAMKECLNEGKAKAKKDEKGIGKAVVIGGGRPTVPPSLKDLLAKPITITNVHDRLITNPNNFNRYKTTKIIGNAAGEALVFKSFFLGFDSYPTYEDIHLGDFIFGLKVIDTDRQQDYKKLIEKVDKNLVIDHPNILGIKERIDYEDHFFCFAFPKMNKSLRSLMDTAFPDGFPRELVAIALKEVVQALVYIHQQGYYHQELNAGHVYFQRDGPAIKIGFLATIYEDNAKDGQINQDLQSGSLARETICEWGAAPEIYNLKQEYTEKSDIWLVGITGMELAYTGLPVKDREQLQFVIERHLQITCRDERGDEKKKSAVGKQLDKMKKKMGKWKGGSSIPISKPVGVSFKEMLALCLKEDPDERPTAEVLLQHDFFQICDNFDLNYFRKAVLEEKEKKK